MKFRNLVAAGAFAAMSSALPALAQNVGNNAGIWWTPAAGQPAPFTFLNPLTTVYGRIGGQGFFQSSSAFTAVPPPNPPGIGINFADGWGMHLGLGVRLMPVLRYELQLGGQFAARSQLTFLGFPLAGTGARLSSVQLLNNLYLDVAPFFGNALWGLNPYLMAGVGASWNSNGVFTSPAINPQTENTHTSFAWNAGVGLQWQMTRNLILDVGYRYLDAGRWQSGPTTGNFSAHLNNRSHQVMFGIVIPVDGLVRGFGN